MLVRLQLKSVREFVGKFLPLAVALSALAPTLSAEPDPGPVDGLGRRTEEMDRSIRYILPDPAFEGPKSDLHPLLPPSRLRAIEPVRIVREVLPNGRLMLAGGRPVAFIGIVPEASSSLTSVLEGWRRWGERLKGKAVRLVFEQETRNASREMAAYVFVPEETLFSGGKLLNETLLAEGLARVDKDAALSPQYRRRFQVAEDRAKALSLGIWAGEESTKQNAPALALPPEFSQHRRGFLGLRAGAADLGGKKRAGEDEPARSGLFPRYRHQPPDAPQPRTDP
jgi:hypothetical protein